MPLRFVTKECVGMDGKLNMKEKPLDWLKPAEYNPRVELQPGGQTMRLSRGALRHSDMLIR